MFDRNKLTHLVFWPDAKNAALNLVDPDGVVCSAIPVREPIFGSAIARAVPNGFAIEPSGCLAVTMSGDIKVTTRGEFDTAVVIERHRPTADERLAALERRALRRERREEAYIRELETKLKDARDAAVGETPPEGEVIDGGDNADQVAANEADGAAAQQGSASANATDQSGAE